MKCHFTLRLLSVTLTTDISAGNKCEYFMYGALSKMRLY